MAETGGAGGKLQSHGGERSNRGAESKAKRFLHRGSVPTSTHQPERLVCSPAGAGGGWDLRLGIRLDPRERSGVGCVNTARRGLVRHSQLGGGLGKSLTLPKRQETIVSGCARIGDSFTVCPQKAEHRLSELQRWARAAANSSDPRDGHEMLTLWPLPSRILCASAGHYPHPLGSLCILPLPGSHDPGTTSPGECTARLRLLERHAGFCHHRLAPLSNYDYCTPPSPWH